MRFFSSHVSGKKYLSVLSLLLIIGVTGILTISPVSAEVGYTQKWMGSPDWLHEKVNASTETNLYKKMQEGKDVEIAKISHLNEGKGLLLGGDFAGAKEKFEQALNIDSNIFDAWLGRGIALEGLKRYQGAIDSYEYAIGLAKTNPYAWMPYAGEARALLENQKYQNASSAYTLAIEKYGTSGPKNETDLLNLKAGLADANEKLGKKTGTDSAQK